MKAEDFIELIEQNRFDKISKNGMTLIAKRFRELENNQLSLDNISNVLPDLSECNIASFNYATVKDYPDFFLIKQTFKAGINWALNNVTRKFK